MPRVEAVPVTTTLLFGPSRVGPHRGATALGLTAGLILVGAGFGLVLIGVPRRGEDMRPFLAGLFMRVAYPSLCLTLIALGAAYTLAWFMQRT